VPGEMYSDGVMRQPEWWQRPDYFVWQAIEQMYESKRQEDYLEAKWENEYLKRFDRQLSFDFSEPAKVKAAGSSI
jgi:hypothetical protein